MGLVTVATHHKDVGLVRAILDHCADVDIRGGKYETALQAGARGSPEIVKLLLEKEADPNIEGGAHGTALQASLSDPACWEIICLMIADSKTKIPEGIDILCQASNAGQIEVVRLLLEKGTDPNIKGGEYGKALQGASYKGKLEIVALLLGKGVNPNAQGGKYGTALRAASASEKPALAGKIKKLLLAKGADPTL